MRRILCVLALLVVAVAPAVAQDTPKAEVSLGYSYFRVNPATTTVSSFNAQGGSGSFAWNLNNGVGIVGDIGGYTIQEIGGVNVDGTIWTYLFGPRFTYRAPERFHPYGHVLVGAARASGSGLTSDSESGLAFAVGGGADVKVRDSFSIRIAQFDYIYTHLTESTGNDKQHNFRFTAGVTFHFGKK